MNVLVINCGSSSLKFQLIDGDSESVLAKGICERIGIDGSCIVYTPKDGDKVKREEEIADHTKAIELVLDSLTHKEYGVIDSLEEIDAIGHRAVHGGEKFSESVVIDDEVIRVIEECSELAPLHNGANLIGINVCRELMPGKPMVAVFDTAFHQTMPEKAYLYGIPYRYYEDLKIRRYGFHGTSHSYCSREAARILGRPYEDMKIIVCHLGNGCSVCAVKDGVSVDTSMGFTPLPGLIMGTRSGDVDPAIIQYISQKENRSVQEVLDILNNESGMYGLTNGLIDFRDIRERGAQGDVVCQRALEMFAYNVASRVGAYAAAMNGVDAIVFTAGIGENSHTIRRSICEYFGFFGVEIVKELNAEMGKDLIISTPESKVHVLVVGTNEELMIARDTMALI